MVLTSISLGSAIFLILTSLLYAQVVGRSKQAALTLKVSSFAVGSAFLFKAFIPNLKLIFQLWESARMPDAPNLTLAKELAVQYGIIVVFQFSLVLLSNFAAYLLPATDEGWMVRAKDVFIAAFMLALAILFADTAAEFGKIALMPDQVSFN